MLVDYCPHCEKRCQFRMRRQTETYTARDTEWVGMVAVMVCAVCGEELFEEQRDARILVKVLEGAAHAP